MSKRSTSRDARVTRTESPSSRVSCSRARRSVSRARTYNTTAATRASSSTAVLETLCLRPGPRLIAGDFNLTAKDVEPLLTARGFTAAPSGPTSPARAPRRRIDWIAVDAGLAVLGSRLHQPVVGDHCPLVADIAVRPGP